jgi:DNA replication protein DnaC
MDKVTPINGQINPTPCDECNRQYHTYRDNDGKPVECARAILHPLDDNCCPDVKAEWVRTIEKAGINRRYHGANFHRLRPTRNEDEYAKALEYCANLEANIAAGRGMILRGPVGTGKTTLGVAVLQEAIMQGKGVMFVPTASLLDNIFTLKATNIEEWARYEDRLRKAGLLLLDDLGTETDKSEGWVITKLDAIISERYNRMLPVLITTNLTSDGIRSKYAERIIDRLKETSLVLNFVGESMRQAAKVS